MKEIQEKNSLFVFKPYYTRYITVLDVTTQQQFVFSGSNPSQTRYLSGNRGSVAMTPAGLSTPGARLIVTDEDYHRMLQSHKRKRTNREVSWSAFSLYCIGKFQRMLL